MVITKIENQKKNPKRYNVYVDGEFAFGISEDALMKFGLRVRDEMSEERIHEIKNYDEYSFAKSKAMNFLSYRIRSAAEVRKKLKTKNIPDHIIDKTIEHLQLMGLVNDEQFALQMVQEKVTNSPVGKKLLRDKLYRKGVGKGIIEKVLEDAFSAIDEKQLAANLFNKYYPGLADLEIDQKKQRVFRYLNRKGFDFDTINEIIREYIK